MGVPTVVPASFQCVLRLPNLAHHSPPLFGFLVVSSSIRRAVVGRIPSSPRSQRATVFGATPTEARECGLRNPCELRSGFGGSLLVLGVRLQHEIANAILGARVSDGTQQRKAATIAIDGEGACGERSAHSSSTARMEPAWALVSPSADGQSKRTMTGSMRATCQRRDASSPSTCPGFSFPPGSFEWRAARSDGVPRARRLSMSCVKRTTPAGSQALVCAKSPTGAMCCSTSAFL